MNPTQALMASHRTVRRFRDEPLSDEAVHGAVSAAQGASTSSNIQAYALIRVRDPERRRLLAEHCGGQAQVREAGAFFVVCGDQRRHRLMAESKGLAYEANLETYLLAVVDASLFAQNLVLAFESEGYGICYIGGLRNGIREIDELLELPKDVLPLYGLCVGVPAEDPGQRPRLPIDAVLLEERYPPDSEMRAHIRRYDETLGAYYENRGRPGWDWSGGIARKFARPLREHLLDYYRSKGARFR